MISWLTAPIIFIIIPLVLAILLGLISQFRRTVIVIAAGVCLILGLFALIQPIGVPIQAGPWTVELSGKLNILGRSLVLTEGDRFLLVFVFCAGAIWFTGSLLAGTNRWFIHLGLVMMSVLVAAVAVEPFLYSALLVEIAVIASIPLLVSPGQKASQGVLRFLVFQTLAIPFILLAGWVLGVTGVSPAESGRVLRAGVLLGLGFAFWLGVFPFYTWIPMLARESNPFPAGFTLTLLPGVGLYLAMSFLAASGWVSQITTLYPVLRWVGVIMIATGGIWAAFQEDVARLLGYAVIIETGYALVAIGLQSPLGTQIFAASYLPRLIGLALWSFALTLLSRSRMGTGFEDLAGVIKQSRWAAVALIVAMLSLGGLPLLAGFPLKLLLLESLGTESLPIALWSMIGTGGFLFAAFRTIMTFARPVPAETELVHIGRLEQFMLIAGMIVLLAIGIFPNGLLSPVGELLLGQ